MVVFIDLKSSFMNIFELKMDFKNDLRYQIVFGRRLYQDLGIYQPCSL